MYANSNAPVFAHRTCTIAAPATTVWHLLANPAAWPAWNTEVSQVQAAGVLNVNTHFSWQSQGITITATVTHATPPTLLVWHGQAMGVNAVHQWQIKETVNGVIVETAQSFEGPAVFLMRGMLQAKLEQGLEHWLAALESTARASVTAAGKE